MLLPEAGTSLHVWIWVGHLGGTFVAFTGVDGGGRIEDYLSGIESGVGRLAYSGPWVANLTCYL